MRNEILEKVEKFLVNVGNYYFKSEQEREYLEKGEILKWTHYNDKLSTMQWLIDLYGYKEVKNAIIHLYNEYKEDTER